MGAQEDGGKTDTKGAKQPEAQRERDSQQVTRIVRSLDTLLARLDAIDEEKAELLAAADMPVAP